MWSPNELLKIEKQRDILSYITLQFFHFKKVPLEHCPLGRDAIPGRQPGVADNFLGILPVFQDIHCNGKAVGTVFFLRLPDGLLRPVVIQYQNLRIFHGMHLLFVFTSKDGKI